MIVLCPAVQVDDRVAQGLSVSKRDRHRITGKQHPQRPGRAYKTAQQWAVKGALAQTPWPRDPLEVRMTGGRHSTREGRARRGGSVTEAGGLILVLRN